MDCFSFLTGNRMLRNDDDSPALELIIAPTFGIERDCWFVITGCRYQSVTLVSPHSPTTAEEVEHAKIYHAMAGSELRFAGKHSVGFRTYLCFRESDGADGEFSITKRDEYGEIFHWFDPEGYIRVLKGPEYRYVKEKDAFTGQSWTITRDFSDMGFRLSGRNRTLSVEMSDMVSEAVADGTIQLTPKGPIVLLRHRQTVGGYPRVYNVISADIDILGQYAPNQLIRFRKVTLQEAKELNRQKLNVLNIFH